MSTIGWVVVIGAGWLGLGVLVGVLVGRLLRDRNVEVEAMVQGQMASLDDEYAELVRRGGAR